MCRIGNAEVHRNSRQDTHQRASAETHIKLHSEGFTLTSEAPNLFIVGAPKCGTTSLSTYLRGHPQVFMSLPKEPHYFSFDLPRYRKVSIEADYLNLFDSAWGNFDVIGEASATYMYSRMALPSIREFNPSAKIIVMLRNPMEMVHSMYYQLLYSRDETENDFERAWHLCEVRKTGARIPSKCRDAKLLYYDELGRLGAQVERVLSVFPKNQVKFIFSEDLFRDTRDVYEDTLHFLGVVSDGRTDFARVNPNRRLRSGAIGTLIRHPPRRLIGVAMGAKRALGLKKIGIGKALHASNTVVTKRRPMDERMRVTLVEFFRDDVILLSRLTGRDLGHWLA